MCGSIRSGGIVSECISVWIEGIQFANYRDTQLSGLPVRVVRHYLIRGGKLRDAHNPTPVFGTARGGGPAVPGLRE
jgi:hypothetical protein